MIKESNFLIGLKKLQTLQQKVVSCQKLKKNEEALKKSKQLIHMATSYAVIFNGKNAELFEYTLNMSMKTL